MPPAHCGETNIVLILADDLGWADLGCYGADLHETPNLDRLAREGVRFTQAYAMSVCSPTRGAADGQARGPAAHHHLGGRGAEAARRTAACSRPIRSHDLPHARRRIAKHLHDAGYLTALVGKWHLGDADHYPETHGFDVNIGGTHWGAPQTFFWPYRGTGGSGRSSVTCRTWSSANPASISPTA